MCGIFGLVIPASWSGGPPAWEKALKDLFILSESRGKEAAGVAIATRDRLVLHKDSVSASRMINTTEYRRALDASAPWFAAQPDMRNGGLAVLGHSRLVTNGLQGIDANNQPVWRDDSVLIHNGIVVNVKELWAREAANGIAPRADVDTEVIGALLHKYRQAGDNPKRAMTRVFADIIGETSIAVILRDLDALLLGTNTGSIYVVTPKNGAGVCFASERKMCEQLVHGPRAIPGFEGGVIQQIRPGEGVVVPLTDVLLDKFTLVLDGAQPTHFIAPLLGVHRQIEDKAERIRSALKNMRRCTRCILPETMPFIAFDHEGVCNYCHTHTPWTKRPASDLEDRLDRIRSKNGEPDCIVAFSGGRDSSYGLHLLKNKYGMTPLTFSYDWGMVTDLARRNQARMCGKLGVEHIWISADIKQKRAHIQRNVLAWLKKPDIGMIPLFMAGDKEVLWHANDLMKSYAIDSMVFCTNAYEKTVFKQGFLGIDARETTVHKPTSLSIASRIDMRWQYGKRFLGNPAYFNRSMPDTLFAFFSYYVIKQQYFSLFDFIPWVEPEINRVLTTEYGWELAKDTNSTWRIGDGTAPFYNYIYHSVAGFTEYDTFRSYQIRDGDLTREQAMALVEIENLPRFDSIREYTQMINIDFDETVRIIDRIPKLYLKPQ